MDSLSFSWYLVAAESSISKQSGVQDALQNTEDDGCTVETCLKIEESCYVYTTIYIVAAV